MHAPLPCAPAHGARALPCHGAHAPWRMRFHGKKVREVQVVVEPPYELGNEPRVARVLEDAAVDNARELPTIREGDAHGTILPPVVDAVPHGLGPDERFYHRGVHLPGG